MPLPPAHDWQTFDALHDDPEAWRPAMLDLARNAGPDQPVELALGGTVLVALAGDRVIKLYPPFLHDHFAFERGALPLLAGRLAVPTPHLLADGEHDGWPYLVMTRLHGEPLTARWPGLSTMERHRLLEALGKLMREVHELPAASLLHLAPAWPSFLAAQRAGAKARQTRTGLPAHLLAELDDFVAVPLDESVTPVVLTGEYTPQNLLLTGTALAGMYDFGDGLVGDPRYDWLGPCCFLAAGDAEAQAALARGYGAPRPDPADLLRLLLLHRYSNLTVQVALDGWQEAPTLEALARRIWP
ncbi:MAG: aminoglycoside 3'-phosphotransferase/choline kinase family protein [Polyangiaceae bacterium]